VKVNITHFLVFLLIVIVGIAETFAQDTNTKAIAETAQKNEHLAEKRVDFLLYRGQDTSYINNMSDQWVLRLLAVHKYNYFQIHDNLNKSSLRYRPELGLNLGLGFAYKWFMLDIIFNVSSENKQFINGKFFDLQANLFTRKQLFSLTIQYYLGYHISKKSGLSSSLTEMEEQRNDIRNINLGLQWLYAFNHERFSMKAPFVFNERQRKSAGSIITGVNLALFVMAGDSIIIPVKVQADFDPQIHLIDLNSLNMTLQIGYMYTFSIKQHFFITLGLIPGIVLNSGNYRADSRQPINLNGSWALSTMNAIGYNGNNFFGGIQYSGNIYNVRIAKKLSIDTNQGNFKLIFGYRFGGKKTANK
jgi:hypothetical protein